MIHSNFIFVVCILGLVNRSSAFTAGAEPTLRSIFVSTNYVNCQELRRKGTHRLVLKDLRNDNDSAQIEMADRDKSYDVSNSFMGRLARTGMKDLEALQVGDIVVAKLDVPSLRIWSGSGYEITAMYLKGINFDTGLVEVIPLKRFADSDFTSGHNDKYVPSSYQKYLEVYNPRDHSNTGPVIVSPDEIGLVTLKSELTEAMVLAIPGFFWVVVAAAFASNYNDRYGGNFFDAFFRT